jgi:hypothetical protein
LWISAQNKYLKMCRSVIQSSVTICYRYCETFTCSSIQRTTAECFHFKLNYKHQNFFCRYSLLAVWKLSFLHSVCQYQCSSLCNAM